MCVEHEDVRAPLADVIKQARNKARTQPTSLLEWIAQVDAQEGDSLQALLARQPQQDLMPTSIAIFSADDDSKDDRLVERSPQTPEPKGPQRKTLERHSQMALTGSRMSDTKSGYTSMPSMLGDSSSLPSSPSVGVAIAGRVHAQDSPPRQKVNGSRQGPPGGGDGDDDDNNKNDDHDDDDDDDDD
eukprot:6223363-Amphidinium_carterae.1